MAEIPEQRKEPEMRKEAEGLSSKYEPQAMEGPLYARWLERGYFHAEVTPGQPRYCITIPPPNVTGELHMGHALCYTIHDVLVRWKRMQGFSTLCLPGTDHAGIATQNVVEKMLAAEGLSRHDLGRAAFVDRVWLWKEQYGSAIIGQLKQLGCSFDWQRERFTMDAAYSDAVLEAFIHLFETGHIYRGTRVTNWCPRCQTAISDIEADDAEQQGSLWYFKYPVENGYAFGTEYITIATTRPETMLGDTAVAVHPDDPRYQSLIGRSVILPLVGRPIPIIGDPILVDPEFGTGALKVTPAHDFNDFEAGLRNGLDQMVVIGPTGQMTEEAGPFAGMDRYEARTAVVEAMEREGLLVKVDDYLVKAPICDRCKTVLEPLLSEQWFCRMKELAAPAIEAVQSGRTRFVPDRWGRVYLDWMEKLRDWCVSRQLWWGHRIPVYYCDGCKEAVAARSMPEACKSCGGTIFTQDPDVLDTWFSSALWPFATLGWPDNTPELEYFYPTDVLITAPEIIYLWVARMIFMGLEFMKGEPFPDVYIYATVLDARGDRMSKSKGNGINPLLLVEQYGADAARYAVVAQAGKAQQFRFVLEKQCPECEHAGIPSEQRWAAFDAERCKRGHVFPLEGVEWRAPQVAQARLFCSKIWQASRFVLMNLEQPSAIHPSTQEQETNSPPAPKSGGENSPPAPKSGGENSPPAPKSGGENSPPVRKSGGEKRISSEQEKGSLYSTPNAERRTPNAEYRTPLEDRWIFSRLTDAVRSVNEGLGAYDLDVATRVLHEFVWSEFCDWYIEMAKPRLTAGDPQVRQNLLGILDTALRLLHPFLPFLTEEIWTHLPAAGETLLTAPFPEFDLTRVDTAAEDAMQGVIELVTKIRNIRSELKVQPGLRIPVFLSGLPAAWAEGINIIEGRARCLVTLQDAAAEEENVSVNSAVSASGPVQIRIPLEGLVDFEKERARLDSERASLTKEIEGLQRQLANEQFVSRAPETVVAEKRRRLLELEEQLERAAAARQRLAG